MIRMAALLVRLMARFTSATSIAYFFALIFFLPLTSHAGTNIAITSWQENTNLNSVGKISEILAQGRVKNLGKNQAMTSFSIGFDPRRNIKITDVICDGKDAAFVFENHSLKIKFTKEKTNGDNFLIYFAYDEKYEKVDKFLRQEIIEIPAFAAGAESKVILNFPGYLESATLNSNVTKQANSFVYSNVVPVEGVREMIKLTPSQNVWDIAVKAKITATKGLNNATVFLPTYFQNGGQKASNTNIVSSTQPIKQGSDSNQSILKFKTDNRTIIIESKARVTTGKNNRIAINRTPTDYLKVSDDERALLAPILDRIKRDIRYRDLPLYAKIGKYVHELIRYDASYTGKLPKINEILKNPVGVCSEYSALYNVLSRVAGIPSINVDGAACGEYDKCMGHAWNIIYYNGTWMDVDPTWDLMSGTVSSSHVYFNDNNKGGVTIQYSDEKESVASTMDFEMKNAPSKEGS